MQNQNAYGALTIHVTTVVMLKKTQWHAVPGKWTENNTNAAEQVFHLFRLQKEKKKL